MTNTTLLCRNVAAEAFGTCALLAAIVGSGIMGETLAQGNTGIVLLANSMATGAMLFVLITMLTPISGAHINPVVTFVFYLRKELSATQATSYVLAQIIGGIFGVLIAHAMFDLSIIQSSEKVRSGMAQGLSEFVATFGLVSTILLTLRAKPDALASAVGLYILAAFWFTASTSFANPAVTIARSVTNTFAGIQPSDAPAFIAAQLLGALAALAICTFLTRDRKNS